MSSPEFENDQPTVWYQQFAAYFDRNRQAVRWVLMVGFVVGAVLLLPQAQPRFFRYEVGRVWQEPDVYAPFEFPILKVTEVYQAERQQAQTRVPEPFLLSPEPVLRSQMGLQAYYDTLARIGEEWRRIRRSSPPGAQAFLTEALVKLSPTLEPREAEALLGPPLAVPALRNRSLDLLREIQQAGYLDRERTALKQPIVSLRNTPQHELITDRSTVYDAPRVEARAREAAKALEAPARDVFVRVLLAHTRPTHLYNAELYEQDVQQALNRVSRYYGKVRAGQLIVASGQRITPEIAGMLESLNSEKEKARGNREMWVVLLGQVLIVSLLTLMTMNFLRLSRREVFGRNRKIALLFFIMLFITTLIVLMLRLTPHLVSDVAVSYFLLVPVTMAPIMVTVFFDDRIGFFSNIIIAVLAGFVIHNNFEFFFIQLCAGTVAVSNLRVLRRRGQFFSTAGWLLLSYFVSYLAYNLYLRGDLSEINYANLILLAVNVLLTLATYPLIYFVERLFGITSDLTYIELLDTDHPLLKELSLKAPGTYQHSLQVANIAESVATKIGANALQVKVAALFHDIGKIYQPEYFIENQHGYNPHERLEAQLSAEIILSHVDYGVELAKQHNLPREIIEFIKTHHGTSRVEHFYRTYRRMHPDEVCNETDFRYKGPLPTSKEMAILMLADSAEAASRSMKSPTDEDIRALLDAVIDHKITDNQLSAARISFRDVHTLKKEILYILANIHHTRSAYAKPVEPDPTPEEVDYVEN